MLTRSLKKEMQPRGVKKSESERREEGGGGGEQVGRTQYDLPLTLFSLSIGSRQTNDELFSAAVDYFVTTSTAKRWNIGAHAHNYVGLECCVPINKLFCTSFAII